MKNLFFYKTTILFVCAFLSYNIKIAAQSETELNDTYQTANNLSVNSAISGTIGFAVGLTTDYDDWYKVTLPSDGKIELVETTSSNLYSGIYVYDANGSNAFNGKSGKMGGNDTLTFNYRAAGVYYIKITNWSSSSGSYTLKANFFPISLSNDIEPNNDHLLAKDLAVNIETTGHLGYSSNSTVDYDDWYKVTLPSDGKIEIVETTSANLYSGISVYDANGSNAFNGKSGKMGGNDTLTFDYRAAGVFYIKLTNWSSSYGSYVLKANFFPITLTNDVEPNNDHLQAKDLAFNTETTGHLGYSSSSTVDYDDWYKVTLPSDGKLEILETTSSNLYSGIYVYEANGSNVIYSRSGKMGGVDMLTCNPMVAGLYYIKLSNWSSSYGSYVLKANYFSNTAVSNVNDGDFRIFTSANRKKMTVKSNHIRSVELYNVVGKKYFFQELNQALDVLSIDISGLTKGVYMLRVSDGSNAQTKKIMIF